MRKNRASSTAKMVALWRALANDGYTTVPGFSDAFAASMLSGWFQALYRLTQKRMGRMGPRERGRVIARYEPVTMRVATIDAELLEAAARGVRQVVVLGAGFDTRAHRFPELAGAKVFEVDHPATQAEKRARSATLPAPHAQLIWTPVDFEHDSLLERLAHAGHDAHAPTVWIWEGVVMYLADPAVKSTLGFIRGGSAAGSLLILHYHEPSLSFSTRALRGLALRWLGEPQIGVRPRESMRLLVESAGFVVTEDLGIAEQAAKVGGQAPDNDLARVSRVMVARLDGARAGR
jgi:methyltransferase (TIGR00027 family)